MMRPDNPLAAQAVHGAMGTVMSHQVYGEGAEPALAAARNEIDRLESCLSRFRPASDVSRINASAGMGCENIGPEAFGVLTRAAEFAAAFPGLFDVTIEPLVAVWSAARATASTPPDAAIQRALALVDYRDVRLDAWEMSAGLRDFGQAIDLGGIGKGYAGDRVRAVYRDFGVTAACSNLGGNVVTLGVKPDGSPWQVGIQHPRSAERIIGSVAVVGEAVVTSGDYQRFYVDEGGRRRHHILDPRTGYPADAGLISATIICEKGLDADALSTILFVAGLERGLAGLKQAAQAEAVLVDHDLRVYATRGLRGRFQADPALELIWID